MRERVSKKLSLSGRTVARVGRGTVFLHSWQGHRNLLEQRLHVVTRFGGRLHEHDVQLLGFRRSFFQRDFPMIRSSSISI